MDWIFEHLAETTANDERLSAYRGRVASLSGNTGTGSKEAVIWGFAPRTTDAPEGRNDDLYDIVVTTDVLAEGVNLQQARHIINYDLPWNPMRLVQRYGRIDRIGSHHSEVFIRCVFPDTRLDELLNLEERLHQKIRQAAASIGVGEVLPDQIGEDLTFTETREEIERIRREEADLFERGGTARGALSGEEYRQELRKAIEQEWRARIEELPWGSGSGMAISVDVDRGPAYVFCARVGDHDRAVFRYVDFGGHRDPDGSGDNDDRPTVVADTLSCLDHARPADGFNTPRELDDDTYRRAFDAWDAARADIVEKWNYLADKANLEPRIPPALARASEVLRTQSPAELTQTQVERAMDSLAAPVSRAHHPHYPRRHVCQRRPRRAGPRDHSSHQYPGPGALRPAGATARDHPRGRPRRLLAGPHLRSAHLRLQPTMIPPCASRPSPTFTSGGPFRTGA